MKKREFNILLIQKQMLLNLNIFMAGDTIISAKMEQVMSINLRNN